MPIKRIEKARASLPPNYQYLDAGKPPQEPRFDSSRKNELVSAPWMVGYLVDVIQREKISCR